MLLLAPHLLAVTVPFLCYPEFLSFLKNKGLHMTDLFPYLPFTLQSSNLVSDSISILSKAMDTLLSSALITLVNSFRHFLYPVFKTYLCFLTFHPNPRFFFFFSGYTY